MQVEVVMPKMGESIQEGKILVVSFIRPNTQEVMLKLFRVEDDVKLSVLVG